MKYEKKVVFCQWEPFGEVKTMYFVRQKKRNIGGVGGNLSKKTVFHDSSLQKEYRNLKTKQQ